MIRISIAAALVLAACQQSDPALSGSASGPAPPVIAGGYAPADLDSADVRLAQTLAVDTIYKRDPQRGLVEKVAAEVQVVSGLNYRFDIKMTGINRYRVVVYKPLQGPMTVTSFEKLPAAG